MDPKIWMDALKPENHNVLQRMIGQLVRDTNHNTRSRLLGKEHAAVVSLEDAAKRKRGRDRAHAGIRESALNWPIWGGVPIRLATKASIQNSIVMRRKQMAEGRDSIRVESAAVQLMAGCSKDALFGDVVTEQAFNEVCRETAQAVAARR
jgi:hypothetical protein